MADATSTVDLGLKEASSLYPKNFVRINYRGTKISYCTAISLGEGTFGKVFKGWSSDGREEMAVKIIDQSFLNQEYKAKENLEREISIMKLMKGCDNVVQIFIAAQVKSGVIITMERCDGDLHKLLESKQCFAEKEVVDFLHQLGEGMRELRKQNIVHRDIKPQNILIKRREQRVVFKLADFGYARHFDATRANKMMNSIVGTPLYMAPEALQVYLFPEQQAHYNDKVDVWSIGALLYKVLVGKDAFPAPSIYQIYQFLKEKHDNIAFELTTKKGKPTYTDELPIPVQRKLSPAFCHAITELLVGMLKFDEKERFSFPTFFDKIEDIIESKIELINLLHGTSIKLISDPCFTPQTLLTKASSTWHIPKDQVVIFSTVYPNYIGAHQQITAEEFTSLIEKSGGQDGHAKLYVLTLQHLKVDEAIEPDMSCFEPLKSALDQHNTEHLVKNLRFMDEIMYMIQCLKTQLRNQRESVGKLYQFAINETGMSSSYNNLKKQVQQTLARVSLMLEVLEKDLEWYGDGDEETLLPELMQELAKKEGQLRELEMEFDIKTISRPEDPFHWKDSMKKINLLIDMTKKMQIGNIPSNCGKLYEYCRDMIADKTRQTRLKLTAYSDVLESTWCLYSKSATVGEISDLLGRIQSERQKFFEGRLRPSSDRVESISSTFSMRNYTSMLQDLRREKDELRKKLTNEMNSSAETKKQYNEAVASWKSSELAIRERDMVEDERTGTAAIEKLNDHLLEFCRIGNQVLRVSKSEAQGISESPVRGKGRSAVDEELLIKAKDLATEIRSSISFIRKDGVQSAEGHSDTLVKISYPENYKAGDVVLMSPINTLKGSVPTVLHLKWKDPHILMDFRCLARMGVRPGKVPQLFLAKLRDAPQKYNLEDYPTTAQDIGQARGIFYRAYVDPVSVKFSDGDPTLLRQEEQHQSLTSPRGKKPPIS